MSQPLPAPDATPSREATLAAYGDQVRRALDEAIPAGSTVGFVDFPYDTNVGNHMMWAAACRYFDGRGVRVGYAAHLEGYCADSLRRAVGRGPIVLFGGVGLGALWPRATALKRLVAREFPENPLVVLPSSLAFRSGREQAEVRDLFGRHGGVTVMARDAATHRTVQETFAGVRAVLVPDSAFLLPPRRPGGWPRHGIGWLARNDLEGTGYQPPAAVWRFDWAARSLYGLRDHPLAHLRLRLAGAARHLRGRIERTGLPWLGADAANALVVRQYRRVSEAMIEAGHRDLDQAEVLVTDRFHAHILAILRGQPVVLLADAYGKNRSSYESWTHRFACVRFADAPREALRLAEELLARAHGARAEG